MPAGLAGGSLHAQQVASAELGVHLLWTEVRICPVYGCSAIQSAIECHRCAEKINCSSFSLAEKLVIWDCRISPIDTPYSLGILFVGIMEVLRFYWRLCGIWLNARPVSPGCGMDLYHNGHS